MTAVRRSSFADLDPATLYGILRLRAAVFVVEQGCAYLDLDGRDREPGAVHCWIEAGGEVVACLRVIGPPEDRWIGRVVTAPHARGRGLAGALLGDALSWCGRPVRIHAQAHLGDWYAGFGFARTGPDFMEDGIPHTPMWIA